MTARAQMIRSLTGRHLADIGNGELLECDGTQCHECARVVHVRRNARGSYSIVFADGSVSVSFVARREVAERMAAQINAEGGVA